MSSGPGPGAEDLAPLPFALGYGTNGLGDHPLPVALDLLEEHGYDAVALTLGFPHLDPWAPAAGLAALRHRLARAQDGRGMRVVIETGTRYLLDPRRKHAPALVDADAAPRLAYLRRAVEVAAALGAPVVQLFSGVRSAGVTSAEADDRLHDRLPGLLRHAAEHGVRLALEPEPGMHVETVADALRLRADLGDPAALGLTVDVGHCLVVEPAGVAGALAAAGPALAHVQIDDMPRTHHDHRPFGEGDLDLPAALSALAAAAVDPAGYGGVVAVELPRHSWDAPRQVADAAAAIRGAWARLGALGFASDSAPLPDPAPQPRPAR
ncbi:sugar phosphate isomerase/epimerase [Cellulomonas sp. PS-H5]|uniref:sugar phosphate isomerase/epimerase family protein n=1 Tax=Cellulomonas sp. PS-H5 TaxID=2820400 RepID=UPI001C4E44E5|nr:sugar phosphate isomerase/epimerase family protein [Cellulomonas sp. PS-H5]MBW0252710.1 sugar phosphate isomerase/epimerase [Cellulomonas sp. PS-H5]